MNKLKTEQEFFHFIARGVRDFVSSSQSDISIAQNKGEGDFSTQVDVGVEKLIVGEIKKRFPQDLILAEEGHAKTEIPNGRIWIIDPICGTNNLARGIKNFCTNIALADNNRLIAACVIDHSQNDYFWSTGDKNVFINDALMVPGERKFDTVIDVDFGALVAVGKDLREKHNRFLKKLITDNNYYLISLNSSLGFTYTAIGKVDGFLNIYNHPWDIAAASFLIEQAGGVITDLDGNPWKVSSVGAIGAKNKEIHQKLLLGFNSPNKSGPLHSKV